jgi:hypothetical protein
MSEAKIENSKTKSVAPPKVEDKEAGLAGTWLVSGTELAEKALTGSFQLLRELQKETHARVIGTLDLIEATQESVNRLARRLLDTADGLERESLDYLESVTVGLLRAARVTTQGAQDVVARLSTQVVGTKAAA